MSDGTGGIASSAFADALARARQLAAKLGTNSTAGPAVPTPSVGIKRPIDESSTDSEPEFKKSASLNDPFGAQLAAMKSADSSRFSSPMAANKAQSEEIKIPDALVGLVIGRGGEQVSRIQAETGCKIQVAPDNGSGNDRPVYLQGTKEAVSRAKEVILEIVSSKSTDGVKLGSGMLSSPAFQPKPGAGQTTAEMMIPGPKVGLVIGKGGETIRSLQDKSGTKMFILQENMFEERDKPLRIVGEPDLVEHARQLVMELINETPPKGDFKGKSEYGAAPGGPVTNSVPGSYGGGSLETMRFPVPKISVGLIIGKGGEMIKRIQMETGAKVQFDPVNSSLGDMDEQLAIITGKPEQLRQAQLKIEALVETALRGTKEGPMSNSAPPNNHWGGGGGSGRRGDQEEERMTVPCNRVGMVIGKGGETIRQINQQSGAHCEIDRNEPNEGPERIFLIRGSRSQIEHAKELIQQKVNTLPPKNQGGHHDGYQHQQQGWGQYNQQQWNQAQNDPSKMAGDASAQWAAYYAQYYAQAQAQPQQPAGGAAGSQPDYTLQWIEYLRSQGQHQQADMLEQQMKASKSGSSAEGAPSAPGTTAPAATTASNSNSPTAPVSSTAGAQPGAGAQQNGQSADYSQAWADHYRSIGKIQEAEAIEAYIKSQKTGGQGGGTPGGPPAAAAAAATGQNQAGAYYSPYGYYGYPNATGGGAGAYGYQAGSAPAPTTQSSNSNSTAPPGTD